MVAAYRGGKGCLGRRSPWNSGAQEQRKQQSKEENRAFQPWHPRSVRVRPRLSTAPVPETCDDGTAYVPVGLCDLDRPRCGVGDRKALERVITHIVAARESVKTAGLHTLPTHAEVLPPDAGRLPTSRGSRSWTTSRGTPLRSSSICAWPTSRPATGCGDRRTLCVARPLCQGGERVIRATATQGLGVVRNLPALFRVPRSGPTSCRIHTVHGHRLPVS